MTTIEIDTVDLAEIKKLLESVSDAPILTIKLGKTTKDHLEIYPVIADYIHQNKQLTHLTLDTFNLNSSGKGTGPIFAALTEHPALKEFRTSTGFYEENLAPYDIEEFKRLLSNNKTLEVIRFTSTAKVSTNFSVACEQALHANVGHSFREIALNLDLTKRLYTYTGENFEKYGIAQAQARRQKDWLAWHTNNTAPVAFTHNVLQIKQICKDIINPITTREIKEIAESLKSMANSQLELLGEIEDSLQREAIKSKLHIYLDYANALHSVLDLNADPSVKQEIVEHLTKFIENPTQIEAKKIFMAYTTLCQKIPEPVHWPVIDNLLAMIHSLISHLGFVAPSVPKGAIQQHGLLNQQPDLPANTEPTQDSKKKP